jgi:hypothetical protein
VPDDATIEVREARTLISEIRGLVNEVQRSQATLLARIDQSTLRNQETTTQVAILTERLTALTNSVDRLNVTVRGDGVDSGIVGRIARLTDRIEVQEKRDTSNDKAQDENNKLRREAGYRVIEKIIWVVLAFVAVAVWEAIRRNLLTPN